MLNRFLYPNKTPPGGLWFYVVPETGVYFESSASMRALVGLVTRHYVNNGMETPPDLEARIEDYICKNVDRSFCFGDTAGVNAGLTFHEINSSTEKLVRELRSSDAPYVSAKEAETRAVTCMTCPLHDMRHCVTCDGLQQTFLPSVGHRTTSRDNMIRACGVTAAVLTVQVHLSSAVVAAHEKRFGKDFPAACWVKGHHD